MSKIIGVIPTEWVALLGFHKLHKVIIGYDFVVLVHDDKPMRVHGIFRTAEMLTDIDLQGRSFLNAETRYRPDR